MAYAVTAIGVFILLVMLLPTLNLININVTRIMERSSEIGVRKAFGASSRTLVYQFIVENIILTLIGGIILGMAQTIGGAINPEWQILAGHIAFVLVLVFRPRGFFPRAVD